VNVVGAISSEGIIVCQLLSILSMQELNPCRFFERTCALCCYWFRVALTIWHWLSGYYWNMAWHSGRTSVFGRRTFPVLLSTCSCWVTIYVGKPPATGQPTRPTQPSILSRSINWVVSCNWMSASSHRWRSLVNAYGVKAWCGWLERWCVC